MHWNNNKCLHLYKLLKITFFYLQVSTDNDWEHYTGFQKWEDKEKYFILMVIKSQLCEIQA